MKKITKVIQTGFREWLPYLAPLSILAYISAITLQFGYYNAFGIDLTILIPRLDPTSLVSISVALMMIVVMFLELKFLAWARSSNSIIPAILIDVIVFGILIFGIIGHQQNMNNVRHEIGLEGPFASPILVVVLIVILLLRIYDLKKYIKKEQTVWHEGKNLKSAYIATSFLKAPSHPRKVKGGEQYISFYIASTLLIAASVGLLPFVVGESIARNRYSFSELVKPTPASKDVKSVVIGLSADGYVVKNYDSRTKQYKDGWLLIKEDSLDLRPVSVETLQDQEKIHKKPQ